MAGETQNTPGAPAGQEAPSTGGALDRASARLSVLASAASARFLHLPALLRVLLVYLSSRVFGWFIFSSVALHQTYSPWKEGAMSYGEFVMIWDADWYQKIAESGYPQVLPLDATGQVTQNEWAFYPLYPALSAALSALTGLGYSTVAPLVSLLAGCGAAWFIYRLFLVSLEKTARYKDAAARQSTALWALAAVSFCAVAPILQTGYAEALGLLFLSWSLLYLIEGRYMLMLAPALGAALSRPVGVPLGAAVGIWWLVCCTAAFTEHRGRPGALGAALKATGGQLACALLTCAFAFLHPAYAWWVTGRIDAYTATETAWRAGGEHVLPFAPWLTQSQVYFGAAGPAVLTVLLLLFCAVMLSRTVRYSLPLPLRIWLWSYALYMLVFFNPQSSTFRLLLPLFALLLPLVLVSTSRAYRLLLLASGAALQYGWVGWLWHWKELPGGGDYPP